MRVMRIELISSAWKADNLPLIYTRRHFKVKKYIIFKFKMKYYKLGTTPPVDANE